MASSCKPFNRWHLSAILISRNDCGKLRAAIGETSMASQPQSPARLAFGPFEVNVPAGQLLKSGVRIRLSGQPLQILLSLLAHPGEVVANEQLREQIWKEGTFVDFEHGLHAAVNKLRRALGDSADNPRYVETVPGRGYRFIGAIGRQPVPISSGSAAPAHSPLVAGANLSPRLSKLRQRWWIAATVALVLITLGTWAASRFRQAPAEERALSLQINPPKGSEFTFGTQSAGLSLSPDGRTAAYVATDHGKAALWVRPLDGTTARLLLGTEDAGMPLWSPDSKSIGFFAQGKLERVDAADRVRYPRSWGRLERQGPNSAGRLEFQPVPGGSFRRQALFPHYSGCFARGTLPLLAAGTSGRTCSVFCPEQQA